MTTLLYSQGVIEIVGGIFRLTGAYTRVVAFILAGDMAAAYFIAHLPRSFFPAVNGGDAAVLYCLVFIYIFFAGSLDRAVLKRDCRPSELFLGGTPNPSRGYVEDWISRKEAEAEATAARRFWCIFVAVVVGVIAAWPVVREWIR